MSKKKEDPQKTPKIRGTHNLTQVGVETDEIRSLILRRRLVPGRDLTALETLNSMPRATGMVKIWGPIRRPLLPKEDMK